VGHRVLEGPQQKYMYMATAPTRRSASSIASRSPSSPASATADAARPVLRGPQHRGRLEGQLYTTETYRGQRLQKFVYKGLAPVTKQNQGTVWPTRTSTH
jgi:hypothetical protein